MKKIMFLAVLAFVVSCGKASAPETWNCDFKGMYKDADKKDVPFNWKVTWVGKDKSWTINGTSTEEGASSKTTGTCDDKNCKIDEVYTSGPENGKKYYWTGAYTDSETKSEDVYITAFKGTYGDSDSNRTNGGDWSASANCKAQK